MPQYALLPPENPPPTGGDCQNNDAAAAEAAAAGGSVAAVIVLLCILVAVGYAVKSGKLKMPGMPSRGGGGGGGGGAAMTAVGGLPPGWTSTLDPSSGRTYYTSPTGATQWEPPAAGGMAPPAAPSLPAPAAPLPPGWQAAVDPGSGKTYYVRSTRLERAHSRAPQCDPAPVTLTGEHDHEPDLLGASERWAILRLGSGWAGPKAARAARLDSCPSSYHTMAGTHAWAHFFIFRLTRFNRVVCGGRESDE